MHTCTIDSKEIDLYNDNIENKLQALKFASITFVYIGSYIVGIRCKNFSP